MTMTRVLTSNKGPRLRVALTCTAVITALLALVPTSIGAQDTVRQCSGIDATLVGTPGDDHLIGTDGPDVISGLQGNDIIFGLEGDDIICGGYGDDIIVGGNGFDILFGAQGNDTLYAATGTGGNLSTDVRGARMFGGKGDDTIWGSERWDRMQGGPGADTLLGLAGRDWIRGGTGNDRVDGGLGIDDIRTASGNDQIDVTVNDRIRAGLGTDTCNIMGQAVQLWSCEAQRPGSDFRNDVRALTGQRLTPPAVEPVIVEAPVKQFTIDGAKVSVSLLGDELPQNASVVEFTGTFIDNDRGGAEACTGPVFDSDPIQCGGIIIDGLNFHPSWTTYRGFVQMGRLTARYSWPPVDGRSTLIEERLNEVAVRSNVDDSFTRFDRPPECADIDELVGVNALVEWGEENPDRFGGVFGGENPRLFALGDLDAIRAELRTDDAEACVVQGLATEAQLEQFQEDITRALTENNIPWNGVGRSPDRISVSVDVADLATIAILTAAIDTPELLEISGRLTIVE